MNIKQKKQLAARTFKVGKKRITLIKERLEEIKQALTKQDIKDLKNEGAIKINEISGRKKVKRKKRKGPGKTKKKVDTRKQDYVKMTRKLRDYVKKVKDKNELSPEEIKNIRNKIRNRDFKSKANLKHYIGGLKK